MKNRLLLCLSLFLVLAGSALAQTGGIRGKVVDATTGESLPNANILIKELNRGAPSDVDGNYSITNVPPGTYTVESSFVGYRRFTGRVTVGEGMVTFNINFEPATLGLDELVVTGYGVQTKREVTGAISQVKAEQIENLPIQSFDQALQGRAAGVQVVSASGAPGGGINVRIRGVGSINGSSRPLYVVDGIQLGGNTDVTAQANFNVLNGINPNDILSIEVLKDAAAAAIYGAQSANGVVLITTKRGRSGGTVFSVNSQFGFRDQPRTYDLLNGPEFASAFIEAYENEARVLGNRTVQAAREEAIRLFGDPATVQTYNWEDEIYRNGASRNFDISASGGTDVTRFFMSGAYEYEEGQVIRSDYKRMSFRANLDHKANERMTLEARVGLTSTFQLGTVTDGNFTNGLFFATANQRPTEPIYNPDGTYNLNVTGGNNMIQYANLESRNSRNLQVISNVAANYRLIPDLTLRVFGGVDYRLTRDSNYRPPEIPLHAAVGGTGSEAARELLNYNLNGTLSYNKSFDNIHSISAILGTEYKQQERESFSVNAQGYPNGLFSSLDQAATPTGKTGFYSIYKLASAFSQLKYDYDNRYVVSGSLRYDGSSRFGADKRWGLFYAVSGAWNLARESFMEGVNFMDDLKLRVSYGITGNMPNDDFASRSLFGGGGTYLNAPGIRPSQLGNNILTWEQAKTINVGLDWAMFGGRFTGAIDAFQRRNERLLLSRSLPSDSGFGSINENAGAVLNEGIEVELNTVNVDRGGFLWSTSFNITFRRDELLRLNEGQDRIGNSYIVGESLGFYWGYRHAGINPADGRNMWYDQYGNITYNVVADDAGIIGNVFPDYYGGFTNTFNYKGFMLDVFFQYNVGQETFNQQQGFFLLDPSRGRNMERKILDRWTTPGQVTDIPKLFRTQAEPGMSSNITSSTWMIESVSYLRLKNATLSYQIPSSLISGIGLRSLKVYATGLNLITWTPYSGLDPELVGTQTAVFPQSRIFQTGIQLQF